MDNFTQPFVFFLFVNGSLYSESKPPMRAVDVQSGN
jgi:hypothetical protein